MVRFSTEMGELGIADRFIDFFQGRAPKGVLAKNYNPQGIRLLKESRIPRAGFEPKTSGDITRKPNIFLALSYY